MTDRKVVQEVVHKVLFPIHWVKDPKPPFVILPTGRRVKVDYMKDGKILFDSGDTGTFRVEINEKDPEQKCIWVEMEK